MAMRVRVYAPAFIDHTAFDAGGFVELPQTASVGDLYRILKISLPLRLVLACSVNYEQAKTSTKLKDGDVVSFLFPISGG
jgi:molybdopterin converting factor small subunit